MTRMRPLRWARRTRWMARAVAADLGLGAGEPPVWRRDNPFWRKTVRADSRRSLLAGRLLLTVLLLSGVLTGGLVLHTVYPRDMDDFLRHVGPLSWLNWLFVAVSFVHVLLLMSTRTAFATSLSLEAERQTLPLLLLTPLRRAEMLWAMAVPPAAAALLIALAGLPLYVFLREFGGCEWRDIGLLYVVFALLAFEPPAYSRPALSADPPPVARTDRASRSRRTNSGVLSSIPFFVFLTWILGMWVRGTGGWGLHLLGVLPPPLPSLSLVFFAWPYCAAVLLAAPLPFFTGHLPPLVYLLPLTLAAWVTSALRTGAALAAGDELDLRRLPLKRRAETLARWSGRLWFLCALAFVWQPWVRGGDTGRLLGTAAPTLAESLAGMLLLLGSAAVLSAARRASLAVRLRRNTQTLRPPQRLARKVWRRAGRPLRLALIFFALACLCGHASPFVPPVYTLLGRLALVAVAAVVCAVGSAAWFQQLTRPGGPVPAKHRFTLSLLPQILLIGVPFVALTLPPAFSPLATLSPATAWLELFPGSDATLHAFPYWPLGPLPPFPLTVAAPVLVGMALLGLAYRSASVPDRSAPPTGRPAAPVGHLSLGALPPSARPIRHPEHTAALMAWVTVRTDNPLFTYEVRTRTRGGQWFQSLRVGLVLLVIGVLAAVNYPDIVAAASLTALLGFFRSPNPFSPTVPPLTQIFADLAALLMSVELYLLALRGQVIGEALFWKDQERGTLGPLLLTPLTAGQILWGKVWGQSSGYIAAWAFCGAAGLALYGLASPEVGLGPALIAWATSQLFVGATFLLGLALGAATAAYTLRYKFLRGVSTLLLILAYGGGVWCASQFLHGPFFAFFTLPWTTAATVLLLGSLAALALADLAFAYACRRTASLRRGDMAFGEGGAG